MITRYEKFIQWCKFTPRPAPTLGEWHHIIPRSMKGDDTPDNLVYLSFREHYIAHWMLWKQHPDVDALCFAFYAMCNKNKNDWRKRKDYGRIISSRVYDQLKRDYRSRMSAQNKDKVHVTEIASGAKVCVTRAEFKANKDKYRFHTAGKVSVKDADGNVRWMDVEQYHANKDKYRFHTAAKISVTDVDGNVCWMDVEQYHANKDKYRFHTAGKVSVKDADGNVRWMDVEQYHANKDRLTLMMANDPRKTLFKFRNNVTGEVVKMTKGAARKANLGTKKKHHIYTQIVDAVIQTHSGPVKKSQYDPAIHTHVASGHVRVLDTHEDKWKTITPEEFVTDRDRYTTPTRGIVNAVNKQTGEKLQITKEEYDNNKTLYAGHAIGLTTVFDKTLNRYVQIPRTVAQSDKSRYAGANAGKVNVIDTTTGIRQQISKESFDTSRHISLGNRKYLFKCQHKVTNKQKQIHIYEWRLVQDQYDVIEEEKFKTLLAIVNQQ